MEDLDNNKIKVKFFLNKKKLSKKNTGMVLTLALNYGAKEEITNAVKVIADKVKNSIISPEKVDQSTINEHLYSRFLPPVDLLIRTSGEERISNFLLWHIAYAELYFTKTLWPDFTKENLLEALINFNILKEILDQYNMIELKKRIITSFFLLCLLLFMFLYTFILIISLIIIAIVAWIEFYALVSKIFKINNFKENIFSRPL